MASDRIALPDNPWATVGTENSFTAEERGERREKQSKPLQSSVFLCVLCGKSC